MSDKNFEKYLQNIYMKEQDTSDDMPNFQIDIFAEMDGSPSEEDKHSDCDDSSQEIDNFIKAEKSKNTVKKTRLDWQKFEYFCKEMTNGELSIGKVPVPELDKFLCKFLKDVRKQNGGEYEPDSLSSFYKSIQRHIKELKLPYKREVLAAKRKNLVKQGRGNKPNACRHLTDEEEAKLFEAREFGCCSPQALQRTLWWFLSMHFGFKARDESRKLCWGDIILETDPETGREVLVWRAERGSKTRQGLEGGHRRQFNPRIYATDTERCPILFCKLFKSHRPNKACSAEFPFFLAVITSPGVKTRPFGTSVHRFTNMRSGSSSQKQLRKLVYCTVGRTFPTIQSVKQVFLVCLMQESQKISSLNSVATKTSRV